MIVIIVLKVVLIKVMVLSRKEKKMRVEDHCSEREKQDGFYRRSVVETRGTLLS